MPLSERQALPRIVMSRDRQEAYPDGLEIAKGAVGRTLSEQAATAASEHRKPLLIRQRHIVRLVAIAGWGQSRESAATVVKPHHQRLASKTCHTESSAMVSRLRAEALLGCSATHSASLACHSTQLNRSVAAGIPLPSVRGRHHNSLDRRTYSVCYRSVAQSHTQGPLQTKQSKIPAQQRPERPLIQGNIVAPGDSDGGRQRHIAGTSLPLT